jgi:hypothetical protein
VEATPGQANNTGAVSLQEITARLPGTQVEPPQEERGGGKIVLLVLPAPKGLNVRQGRGSGGGNDSRAGGVMGYGELLERVALGVRVCRSSPRSLNFSLSLSLSRARSRALARSLSHSPLALPPSPFSHSLPLPFAVSLSHSLFLSLNLSY